MHAGTNGSKAFHLVICLLDRCWDRRVHDQSFAFFALATCVGTDMFAAFPLVSVGVPCKHSPLPFFVTGTLSDILRLQVAMRSCSIDLELLIAKPVKYAGLGLARDPTQ